MSNIYHIGIILKVLFLLKSQVFGCPDIYDTAYKFIVYNDVLRDASIPYWVIEGASLLLHVSSYTMGINPRYGDVMYVCVSFCHCLILSADLCQFSFSV